MPTITKIQIQDGEKVIELVGADKKAFIEQQEADYAEAQTRKAAAETQLQLKKSAYTKLGLTEEEINAIL